MLPIKSTNTNSISEIIILSASDSNSYVLYVFRIEYQLYKTSNDSKGLKEFFFEQIRIYVLL